MPRRSRATTDDLTSVSIHTLSRSRKLILGRYTQGFLLGNDSPRFSAFLGYDGIGWIEVGTRRWSIGKQEIRRGGFRLVCRGSNGKAHLSLFISRDGTVGSASELRLIYTTQRMRKAKRVLHRRGKLLRRLVGRPVSLEWVKAHPDYHPTKPYGMSRKRYRRLVNEGIYYRRKRMPRRLSREQKGVDDIEAIRRIFS